MNKIIFSFMIMVVILDKYASANTVNNISNFLYLYSKSNGSRTKMSCTSFYGRDQKKIFEFTAAHCLERPFPFKKNSPFVSYTAPEDVSNVTKFPWWGDDVYTVYEAEGYKGKYRLNPDDAKILSGKDIAKFAIASNKTKKTLVLNITNKLPKKGDILYSLSFPDGFGPSKLTCEVTGFAVTPISDFNDSDLQLSFVCDPVTTEGRRFGSGSSGAPLYNKMGQAVGVLHRDFSQKYGGYLATPFSYFYSSMEVFTNLIVDVGNESFDQEGAFASICFNKKGIIENLLITIPSRDLTEVKWYYKEKGKKIIKADSNELKCLP